MEHDQDEEITAHGQKVALFKEDFSLILEAGFIAIKQCDEISATRLFRAAQEMSPLNTAPTIGVAYIALNKLEVKKATALYEQVLAIEPDNTIAQTFLGICFLLTKNKQKKGEKLIREAMEKTTDPTIKNLGAVALEWSAKDLSKKDKIPFFSSQKDE